MGKRFFDIVASVVGLCLLFPLFLVIIILILLIDAETPFFVQQRMGKDGRPFLLIKFRTMKRDVASEKNDFEAGQTLRITPLGKVLRKLKLDELPQLVNVLKGDMSLVGPRPEVEKWTLVYPEKWKIVHTVKPGITDNAAIMFSKEEEILAGTSNPENVYRQDILPVKLNMYIKYVQNHSFSGDIKIIFRTIKSVWLN